MKKLIFFADKNSISYLILMNIIKQYKDIYKIYIFITLHPETKNLDKRLKKHFDLEGTFLFDSFKEDIDEFFVKNNVTIKTNMDANSAKTIQQILSLDPISVINIRGRQKFDINLIETLKKVNIPFVNIHPSILPDYRGLISVFWSMFYSEKLYGVTLHKVNQYFDAGDIIDMKPVRLDLNISVFENLLRLLPYYHNMIVEFVNKTSHKSPLKINRQNEDRARYYSCPTTAEIDRFEARGLIMTNTTKAQQLIKNELQKIYAS